MSIELLNITHNPLQFIGKCAGVCWNAPIDDAEKNRKRAISCIKSGHGRVIEFPDITLVIDNYSARMMRELYTHIGGAPTRVQSSTRYVDADNFKYYTPPKVANTALAKAVYDEAMAHQATTYDYLMKLGIPKEDAANQLPIGMKSKMVWKINVRTLINFMNKRLCTRALKEIRDFAKELKNLLSSVDDEWKWICDNLFVPTCEQYKFLNPDACFCIEKQCCGRHPHITNLNFTEKEVDK
jgi:thymidylate synthase (FAD)